MKRKYKYSFAKKQPAQEGVVSTGLGVFSLLLFLAAVIVSMVLKESGGAIAGGLGLLSMLLSIYGFILGMRSFREKEKNYRYSIIGALGNGIFAVCWLGIVLAVFR